MSTETSLAPALAARGLTVGYGDVVVVRDLDLELQPGQITALLGANGAGKTTALLGLAGVLPARAGAVEMEGRAVTGPTHRRVRRAGLGFITQERCVFMGLSVRDNLKVGGVDADIALEYFPELRSHLARRVGLLSGGQQQMLAVARAIARRPKVLLADELSLGLAPMVVDRIYQVISRACREQRLAVLIVEQQVVKALNIADRGAILRRGHLELVDEAQKLRRRLDDVQRLYL
jgi:branched-chain amino acid transport system ATP-binding protein